VLSDIPSYFQTRCLSRQGTDPRFIARTVIGLRGRITEVLTMDVSTEEMQRPDLMRREPARGSLRFKSGQNSF
jgi:hypothetical protein